MNFFKEGGGAVRLEAAGRQARAEVQGPQTQLYGEHTQPVHWNNPRCTHGDVVCEFTKTHTFREISTMNDMTVRIPCSQTTMKSERQPY